MGINLKIARIKMGLSQGDLCKLTGISKATMSELENGKGNPRMITMMKIAKVLKTSPEELFFRSEI